jgi:HSP20 family protein
MNLVPWKNKTEENRETGISRFRDEFDSMFDRFMGRGPGRDFFEPFFGMQSAAGPRLDLSETDHEITARVELPGIDPKEVDVRVEGNALVIAGEKKLDREEKQRNYHFVERQYGSFTRRVQLPSTVDPNQVDASYKDGILTVNIAKRPEAQPRRIEVRAQ